MALEDGKLPWSQLSLPRREARPLGWNYNSSRCSEVGHAVHMSRHSSLGNRTAAAVSSNVNPPKPLRLITMTFWKPDTGLIIEQWLVP